VSGRRPEAGEALAAELQGHGGGVAFVQADVRHEDEVLRLVDETVARFGRLDIAVNNAGTEGTPGPVVEATTETYNATFDTNVLGTLLCMKHELRVMQPQGSGNIINISSALGKVGVAGGSVYVASKHAIEGLTKSAAHEAGAFGVRVNAVAPGPVETGMLNRFTGNQAETKAFLVTKQAIKRVGASAEIADAITFIASAKASFVTGHSFGVDGGYLA
jgi:NAD(P)-dependent dehydrogenase (short-subunit alcohol dehydrogenase family)